MEFSPKDQERIAAEKIYVAARDGDFKALTKAIEQYGTDFIHSKGRYGQTPFFIATAKGEVKIMQYLAELGASTKERNFDGDTPTHAAARNGQLEALMLLKSLRVNAVTKSVTKVLC